MSGGGLKYDDGKPDLSLVSYELLEEVAYVRMFGAKKYSRDNWKKGFKVTRSCAAALRHIFLFLAGETNDKESGRPHLAHAVCCLEHALHDMRYRPENDDRKVAEETPPKPGYVIKEDGCSARAEQQYPHGIPEDERRERAIAP